MATGSKRQSMNKTVLIEFVLSIADTFNRTRALKASLSAKAPDGIIQSGDFNATESNPLELKNIGASITLNSYQAFFVTITNEDSEVTFRCEGTLILFGKLQKVLVKPLPDEVCRLQYVVC